MELQQKRDSQSNKGGGEEEAEVEMQSRRSRVPGNNLLTAEVDSRRKKRAQQGKMFSSLVWDEESSIVVRSAENGETHEDLPRKEGEQDDLRDLQCRRLCRPRNTLFVTGTESPGEVGGRMWSNVVQ